MAMRSTYSQRKMAKLYANSGDPDQTPRSANGLFANTFYGYPNYNGLINQPVEYLAIILG